jgi:UDP-galactopyranose mutase
MSAASSRDAARVVVVGGGFGGIATALRLAKLGHSVTLLEAGPELGGRLRPVRHAGVVWDSGPTTLTLPPVLRDLFRKSGRPLEAELDLVPCQPGRRHVFGDTVLDLPFGSRAAQRDALGEALGGSAATAWTEHLDALSDVWEVLRRRTLDVPFSGRKSLDRDAMRVLRPRRRLATVARSLGPDPRLRALLLDRHRLAGQQPRALPGFLGVVDHVERGFGRWRVVGGMAALLPVLERRLGTRGVDVRLRTSAVDVRCRDGRAHSVLTAEAGELDADVVVWSAPRRPPLLGTTSGRQPTPAIPAARTYLALEGELPELPAETFLHGDPLVLVRSGATASNGLTAWSVEHRQDGEDVVTTMARRGLDVRRQVGARVTRSPAQLVAAHGGSPAGMLWQGWRSGLRRPGPRTAVKGLYLIGADVHPGPGLISAGLVAAQVAGDVGRS